jgi:tetratricopeptide (TPR) repeat protein
MRWLVLFASLVSAAAQPRQDLMADTLVAQGRYLEADAAYSELLHSKPDVAEILLKRGAIRMCLGRYTEARTDLENSLARASSPAGLSSAHAQMGLLEQIQGRYATAIHHHLITLQLKQEAYGPLDPTIGVTWNRLGEAYLAAGSLPKAGEAIAAALRILSASLGNDFHLCLARVNAGHIFLEQRRFEEAAKSLEQARESDPGENGCAAMIASGLGRLHSAHRDFAQAEASFRESIRIGQRLWPDGHMTTASALQGLARVTAAQKRFDEARKLFQQSLEMDERVLGPTHPDVREVLLDLAALLQTAHRGSEARRIAARVRRDFPESLHSISIHALGGGKM